MAQRRVAATGFGGAQPGVSILSGLAQGMADREERESELQRRAILNRLSQAQIDRQEQATRHAREDFQFKQQQRERAATAMEAAASTFGPKIAERFDLDPSEGEERSFQMLSHLLDLGGGVAELDRADAATESSRASTRRTNLQNRMSRAEIEATELLADEDIQDVLLGNVEVAQSGGEDLRPRMIRKIVDEKGLNVSDAAIGLLTEKLPARMDSFFEVAGQGASGELSPGAQRALEVWGGGDDVEAAIRRAEQEVRRLESEGAPDDVIDDGKNIVRELKSHRPERDSGAPLVSLEEANRGIEDKLGG